jgi:hypothetical protein
MTSFYNEIGAGAGAGAGPGREAGGQGGWGAIAVQPPTKLYFCQTPETPEPMNKCIFYIPRYHAGGQKTLLPGVSLERYGKGMIAAS